ncbi:ACT domain-containing protein [Hydrogenophaga borbori]
MTAPPSPLDRFLHAQARDYPQALTELKAGQKRTHWIWYVLPQLRELGRSQRAREYGIRDRQEAADYLAHPVLGPRLVDCVNALLGHPDRSAVAMLGEVDAMKLRSCLTLFAAVAPQEPCFAQALAVFYQGQPDEQTLRLLDAGHMPAEHHLPTLLKQMTPSVHPEVFVFCCFSNGRLPEALSPVGSFHEPEGLTAIVPLQQAQALGLAFQFESRMVTLTIHSALDAVGFLARISAALASQGIACNVVSAFHHDHLFVPRDRLDDALRALDELSRSG